MKAAGLLLASAVLVAGCSSGGSGAAPGVNSPGESPGNPPIAAGPAEPGLAPPLTVSPVGRVLKVGNNPEAVAIGSSGTAAVGLKDPDGIALVDLLPPGPPQPGGLAAVGKYAVSSDVRGQGVWVYDASTGTQVAQAPVGQQLTHTIALAPAGVPEGSGSTAGAVAVADTMGGAVYLERITPQVQQLARIDAPGRPYGLGYDAAHQLLLVTLTASNLLRVIDVADPSQPKVLGDLPTVRQPNSVAVDPRSGMVVVGGNADGMLQLIPPVAVPHR